MRPLSTFSASFFHLAAALLATVALAGVPVSASPASLAATLYGTVTDAATGETLIGASVRVDGTSLGAATDYNGDYRLPSVPAGDQVLVVSYIGYEDQRIPVSLADGGEREVNVALELAVIEGEDVVITAQAEGQVAAINQQRSSNQIVNVVSAARIRELPDANAAESVGRLPGISIQRNAGEAENVVIRGLSPKYSNVTVNGVRLPSTDVDQRSTDLSMVSSEMLSGVEVYKSLTPAQDADAIGGSVNFRLRGAPEGLRVRSLFQTGYSGLTNSIGQYKGNLTVSDRFFGDRFGVFVQGNLEQTDRSSERVVADYLDQEPGADDNPDDFQLDIEEAYFRDRAETRNRYGVSTILDYRLPFGTVQLTNFANRLNRDYVSRDNTIEYNVDALIVDLRDVEIDTEVFSTALSGSFDLGNLAELDATVNWASSSIDTPYDSRARFLNNSAIADEAPRDQGPFALADSVSSSPDRTFFERLDFRAQQAEERDLAAKADLRIPYRVGTFLSGYVQTGGKLQTKSRTFDNQQEWLQLFFGGENGGLDELEVLYPDAVRDENGLYSVLSFLDEDREGREILDGQYETVLVPDADVLRDVQSGLRDVMFRAIWGDFRDYSYDETITAGYVMTEINLGPRVMLLPGIRYEQTRADYDAFFGRVPQELTDEDADAIVLRDTSDSQRYQNWFPMAQLRVRPTDWFDVRLAYTRTQSRPDFSQTSPRFRINDSANLIDKGTPELRPAQATNYDAYLTFYSNRIGLFSVGGFYKNIEGVLYESEVRLNDAEQAEALGYPGFAGYDVEEPRNLDGDSWVRGIEVDWQSNLTWLPGALSGLVVNANVTRIFSESEIERRRVEVIPGEPPFFIDTFVFSNVLEEQPLLDQPDWIANLAVGYDRGPFSGRVSMLYQEGNLTGFGTSPRSTSFFDSYLRWDAQVSYDVLSQLSVFGQLNNVSNRPDISSQGITDELGEQEFYGASFNVGLRYRPF